MFQSRNLCFELPVFSHDCLCLTVELCKRVTEPLFLALHGLFLTLELSESLAQLLLLGKVIEDDLKRLNESI